MIHQMIDVKKEDTYKRKVEQARDQGFEFRPIEGPFTIAGHGGHVCDALFNGALVAQIHEDVDLCVDHIPYGARGVLEVAGKAYVLSYRVTFVDSDRTLTADPLWPAGAIAAAL